MRANLLLAGVGSLLALLIGEALVRLAQPELLRSDGPILMASVPMVRHESGAVRLTPRREGRCAVWAANRIAFDTRFRTNNGGFLDHRDYPLEAQEGRSYAFVGDSYAAGIGGSDPWVPRLRDETGKAFYNLAIPGTGVQHFRTVLASLQPQIEPDEIVIVAISDDFFRPLWRPYVHGLGQSLCLAQESEAECRKRPPQFYLVENDADEAALARLAEGFRGEVRARQGALRRALKSSQLLVFVKRALDLLAQQRWRAGHLDANLEALRCIREDFKSARISFVHVPDKGETRRKRYEVDPEPLLRRIGAGYFAMMGRCGWSEAMFHEHDNHPNVAGYAALKECVARHLDLGRP